MNRGGNRIEQKTRTDRARLAARRDEVPVVQDDHRLLGINTVDDGWRGFYASPIITDIVDGDLFNALRAAGLEEADARHMMYAIVNNCDVFATLDTPHFIDGRRREALQICCAGRIRILLPSEFVASMRV